MGIFDFLSGDASVDASVSVDTSGSADAGAGGTATAVDGDNISSSGNGGDGSGDDSASATGLLQISSTPVDSGPLLPFDTTGSGQAGTVNPWATPAGASPVHFVPPPAAMLPPSPYAGLIGPWPPPPPAPPPAVFGTLPPMQRYRGRRQRITTLGREKMLKSPNGLYGLRMQKDGNLVLFKTLPNQPDVNLWTSNTAGISGPLRDQAFFSVGDDGNATVSTDHFKHIWWASQTAGNPGAALYLQDDGNLVLYRRPDSREVADILWSSGTIGAPNGEALNLLAPPQPAGVTTFTAPEPVYFDTNGHPRSERREEREARTRREDALRRGDRNAPAPVYYDERGKIRAERDNERAARITREGSLRSRGGLIQHPEHDVRHDEHGRVTSSSPVIINPHRPDPSGGYHHNRIDGSPTPIHPLNPPAHPDPVVIAPTQVSNPISPVPAPGSGGRGRRGGNTVSPVIMQPVATPVSLPPSHYLPVRGPVASPVGSVPVATGSGGVVSTPVMPASPSTPVITRSGTTKSGLDSSSGGSLESGAGSTLPETGGSKAPAPTAASHGSPGGGHGPAHPVHAVSVAGEPTFGLEFEGFQEGMVLGESEIGGPVLSRRFGVFKPSIA